MKTKIMSGVALCALAFAPMAFASNFKAEEGYVGIEAIQTSQKFKTHFGGKKLFKKNPQDYSVFGGFKFHKHFGAEVGYEFQPKRTHDASFTSAGSLPGQTSPGVAFTTHSRLSHTSPYVGLFAEQKCHFGFGKMKFQGLVGASVTKLKAAHKTTSLATPALVAASIHTYSKTKVVPMVKIAAIYMATEQVGIKLSGSYRNMSAFKINSDQSSSPAFTIKPKDSWGVGLGLTYNFN